MSYIVPVHRPSGVRYALKLCFIHADEEALIVAKANRLEVYTFSAEEGLVLVHSRSVYGYISMLSSLRPASSSTDHLFVGTDRYQYFTCSWDASSKTIKTEQSYVDQADRTLRDTKDVNRVRTDPTRRFLSLEIYDGTVSVIPIVQPSNKRLKRGSTVGTVAGEAGTLGEPVQIRTDETVTRDSAFLEADPESKENPRLAILWEDNADKPQLKLRELKSSAGTESGDADLIAVADLQADLELGVSHLIPVSTPFGGFLLLGERTITYVDSNLQGLLVQNLDDAATIWACWTKVDETRWLLADDYGRLFFLMIESNEHEVTGWRLDTLGEASKASCLVYLDAGVVFIGSHSGDSQLVQIVPGSVEVLQTLSNIAPILDFSIMDLGRGAESSQAGDFSSGQARIVAASGAWENGSIRSVRSGVSMEDLASIADIPLINDMWALNSTGSDGTHDLLLTTFTEESRIFKFDLESNVEELGEFGDLELSEQTVLATNLPDRKLLQVHRSGVRVTDLESGMSIFQWKSPDAGSRITGASANGAHLVVIQGGLVLHVFHISGHTISAPVSKTFPVETQISSVTIPDSQSNVCMLSFWQNASISVVDIHSFDTVNMQTIGQPGKDVPRSILLAQVIPNGLPTLFVAMADGTVVTFQFDASTNSLSSMTRILLGVEPVILKALPRESETGQRLMNIFASCEQPSLIYAAEGRIIYSAVNAERSTRVCHLNSEAFPGAVAVASPTELKLASIGTTRTTQLQTLPVGETVRCLAYEPKAKIFGMGCVRRVMEDGEETLQSSVKIADEVGFKELDSVDLLNEELVECVISIPPGDDDEDEQGTLFVVGTSLRSDNESLDAPQHSGRILVYRVDPKRQKLKVVVQLRVRGACRCLALCEGMIVAGLVKVVLLYRLSPSRERGGKYSYELDRLASYRTSTNPLSLAIQPATADSPAQIVVADLMRSISILSATSQSDSLSGGWELREIARHYSIVWTAATAVTAENEYVLADMEGNLMTLRRNTEAVGLDEQKRLEVTGEMRLGEVVNRIVAIKAPSSRVGDIDAAGKERRRTMSSADAAGVATATAAVSPSTPKKSRTATGNAGINQASTRATRIGTLIQPQAFIATVEGSLYLLGAVNPAYTDALIRLQTALASKVQAPGYMPWSRYRALKTETRETDEPFRFIDGEMVESALLTLSSADLEAVMKEHGLTELASEGGLEMSVDEVRAWGEELRRLY